MSKEKGIDISYWQGNIDFKKVKMSDMKFVILREGYRQTMDKKFMDYVFGCRTWGIRIDGVYHFIYLPNDRVTSNSETGILNAQACLQNVRNAQLRKDEIIIWCDLEYDTITHAKRQHGINLSNQDIKEITVAFCNEISKSGYRVGLYTNLDYAKNKYGMDFVKQYDLWLADYTGVPDLDCLYQQYTSEGQVDGINGKVDMNWKFNDTQKEEKPMGVTANDVLSVARGWLGCNERDGSFKKIIDFYNSNPPLARRYKVQYDDEWCDTFVSAVAIKAGARDLIGTECGCEQHVKIFQQKGIWIEDGTITPKPGDIILYNWDSGVQPNDGYSDHIGYVESVAGYTVTLIEGNKGEAVARRNIRVGHGNIRGYARPKYAQSSSKPVQPQKPTQDIDSVARDVIAGKYGNGDTRRQALINAGYNPDVVQERVNALLSGSTSTPSKSIVQIAKEVLQGKWGNGDDRKNRLESAGYDFNAVQAEVNRLLSGAPTRPTLKPVNEIAREVLQGKWGNGSYRKSRLESAGYNYDSVQAEVNRISGAQSVDIDKIAHDVIKGIYGNGTARRNALVQKYGASVADAVQRRVNQLL